MFGCQSRDMTATRACHASRSEVIAPHGMAATSQPLATQVALDILQGGGNAIDAAIAANAALGLMEPPETVWVVTCSPLSGMRRRRSWPV